MTNTLELAWLTSWLTDYAPGLEIFAIIEASGMPLCTLWMRRERMKISSLYQVLD